jgi:GNAT superfamily N-acetyltransferase
MAYLRCILLTSFFAISFNAAAVSMVIDAPPNKENPTRTIPSLAPSTNYPQFRIRRARVDDLDAISTMLAMESVPSESTPNWNDGMRRLRAKSEVTRQLFHRLAALEAGRDTASRLREQYALHPDYGDYLCSLSVDYDACHQLWRNGNFRSKVQTAVAHSQEKNAWKFHNFDLAPSIELLNHVMMSVVDLTSGVVVGFCEVALLPCPSADDPCVACDGTSSTRQLRFAQYTELGTQDDKPCITHSHAYNYSSHVTRMVDEETPRSCGGHSLHHGGEVGSIMFAPAVVNLVTSPSHRRMGIASRVLKFASRFTTTKWRSSYNDKRSMGLGLYVHPENESALRLYTKGGFSQISSGVIDGLIYMRKV